MKNEFQQLSLEQVEEFFAWAFGDDWRTLDKDAIKMLKAWNSLHYNLLHLKPDGNIVEDLNRMVAFWKERNK